MSKRRKVDRRRGGRTTPKGGGGRQGPAPRPWLDDDPGTPRADAETGGAPPPPDAVEEAERLLWAVASAPEATSASARRALLALPGRTVARAAGPVLLEILRSLWAGGWQPAELVWSVQRTSGAGAAARLVSVIRADASGHEATVVHALWRRQLDDLGVEAGDRASPPSPRWLEHELLSAAAAEPSIDAVLDVVAVLARLPRIQVLLPPPGRPDIALEIDRVDEAPAGIDPQLLARVRALLAKAESTTFEAEAQAFTAKAHELMTRHALEHSVVASAGGSAERPTARRILLDDPYADAKARLVQVIAEATRCRAVQHVGIQMSTVVGFEADVAGVEVLFTSLLVQAQTVLQEIARVAPPGSRERSRSFRSSFLAGFAYRIGDRLEEGLATTVAEVDRSHGGALVPVLAARKVDVEAQTDRLFPSLRMRAGGGPSDALGWRAGQDAADRADLPWERLGRG